MISVSLRVLFGVVIFLSSPIALAQQSGKPLQKLTVILDWFVNPDHAPLFVAQQQGYYKDQGLDVTFIAPADPSDPPKLVAVGKADIGVDYQPHLLMEISQGLPLVQIGTLVATPLSCLAVLADGPIHNIKDLKGKRIGYSVGGIDSAVLKSMLNHNGLSLNDVELINVKFDLTQALLAKKVDAVIGVMRNFELLQMQILGHPARAFYPEENGMPPYDELVLITNKKERNDPRIKKFLLADELGTQYLVNHPEERNDPRIEKFLMAVELGTQYLVNHPEESWQQFAKNHPELNNELNRQAWFATLPRFALRPAAVDPSRCQNLALFLKKNLNIPITDVCEN